MIKNKAQQAVGKALTVYNSLSVQARASIWFVFCSVLQKGISFLTVPIFTRLMTTDQYGYYNKYVSWYSILLVFTSMSLYYGVFNNAMMKYRDNKVKFVSSMQGLVTVVTAAFFVVYLLFRSQVNVLLGLPTHIVLMLFAELLVTPSLQFWSAYNRFEYQYRNVVIVTLIKSLANPLLGILLVLISEDKACARIVSTVTVEFIVCGLIAIVQFYKGKCFFDKEFWKYAFLFNLPLIPHYLSGQVLNHSDRIMIGRLVDDTAVAMYSVAYSIGLLMNIFTLAINGTYTPWFYQSVEKKKYQEIRKITLSTTLLMAALVVILMLFAPELMDILGGRKYSEAVYAIPPVAASVYFIFLYNIFANVEFYFEKKVYVLVGSTFAAIVNLILNYVFIPVFGYIAAGYTTLFCYILYCFMHSFFAVRVAKANGISERMFDFKWIYLGALVVTIIGVVMNVLYKTPIVRYGIILGLILVFLLNRKDIIRIMTKLITTLRKKEK
jgi:O-antigen/teichoic acid export membrane protein